MTGREAAWGEGAMMDGYDEAEIDPAATVDVQQRTMLNACDRCDAKHLGMSRKLKDKA